MLRRRAAFIITAIAILVCAGGSETISPTAARIPPAAETASKPGPASSSDGAPAPVDDATRAAATSAPVVTPAVTMVSGNAVPTVPPLVKTPNPVDDISNGAPLPNCAYADAPTPLASQADWPFTLVDTTYELPSSYVPDDLVSTTSAGIRSGYYVRGSMTVDLKAMAVAAASAGVPLGIASAYRDYLTQRYSFNGWVETKGYPWALIISARQGHSEHQLGTAIDFMGGDGESPWIYLDWATETKTGAWLAANAWLYGFVMSYPKRMTGVTCYAYEPWHYRYVGRAAALSVRESGLTLREWLWQRQPALPWSLLVP